MQFGQARRIARKKRLDIEWPWRDDDEIDLVSGDVHARDAIDQRVHLRHHDAVLESCRLHDGRRVLGIGAGIEIPFAIGRNRRDQRDIRREIHEVAGKQLQIGVDGAEFDGARPQRASNGGALRTGIGKIELLRDAAPKQVDMLGKHDARLYDMQVVQFCRIGRCKRGCKVIRLFLIVAFDAQPVTRTND